jgi:DNA repair exonuclease SbcCD nuclease subunit
LFRFLHAADIHLDSPLRGLERYEGAPVDEIRSAPRRALENLVQFAIDEEVEFLLLAGDLYDGDWKDYNTGLFFIAQMRRLEEAGIGVHLIAGNHDAASQITKQLALPENVILYSHAKPQTVELPELGVAIHGQSFKTRSVTQDLAAGYPMGEPDRLDIGLLHSSLDGRPGHDDYAPSSVAELRSKGYDYWALGHVHQREIVSEDPWIVFPGNLQGRHARETGEKGATLVTVVDGEISRVEHHAFDVVRWVRLEVDLTAVENADEIPDRVRSDLVSLQMGLGALQMGLGAIQEGRGARQVEPSAREVDRSAGASARLLALRLVLTGRSAAHSGLVRERERWIHEIRSQLATTGGLGVFLEKVEIESRSAIDLEAGLEREDALGDLLRMISGLEDASFDLEEFVDPLREIRKKLPPECVTGEDAFDPTDPDRLRELLPAVRDLLLTRLVGAEEST